MKVCRLMEILVKIRIPTCCCLSEIQHPPYCSAYKRTKDSLERFTHFPYIPSYTSLILHITGINAGLVPGLLLPSASVLCINLLARDQMSTSEHAKLFPSSDCTCLVNLFSFTLHFVNEHPALSKECSILKY